MVGKGAVVFLTVFTLVFGARMGIKVYNTFFAVPGEVDVPNVVGKDKGAAEDILSKLGLNVNYDERYQAKVPASTVVQQFPGAQTPVRSGSTVSLIGSKGPEIQRVPDVTGLTLREARITLENARLAVGKIVRKQQDGTKAEEVLEQDPAPNSELKKGARVTLTVTTGGKSAVTLPNYEGLQLSEVKDRVDSDGLKIGTVVWVINPTAPAGEVVQQIPAPKNAVQAETPVDLQVSAGSDPRNVQEHRTMLDWFVPAGPQMQTIKIDVNDVGGTRTVYQASMAPGQKVQVELTGLGDACEYLVYADDRMIKRMGF
ncbi:MAG: PASTA domain-containing protein [Candidatus Xenobia bacterium]